MRLGFVVAGDLVSGAEYVFQGFVEDQVWLEPIVFSIVNDEWLRTWLPEEAICGPVLSGRVKRPEPAEFLALAIRSRRTSRKLRQWILEKEVAIVVTNNSRELAWVDPRPLGVPVYAWIHDQLETWRVWRRIWVTRHFGSVAKIIVDSHGVRRGLEKLGIDGGRVAVAPNAVPKRFREVGVLDEANVFKVGFVGSCIARKAPHIVLDALGILHEEWGLRVPAQFVFSWKEEGYWRRRFLPKLQKALRNGFAIEIVWDVSRDSIKDIYRRFGCLCVPSEADPLPTVVLEAAALGVPVIGRDVGGIGEMIFDRRFLVENNPGRGFAEAIAYLMTMPPEVRSQLRKDVSNFVLQRFTPEAMAVPFREAFRGFG